jgi:lysophospholipase L1-like esterase
MGLVRRFGILRSLGAIAVASMSVGAWLLAAPLPAGASGGAPITPSSVSTGSRYLALGDSVTFGYEEGAVVPHPNYKDASSFLGYPEILGRELHLTVANLACPGETSSSLINPKAQSNGCENAPGAPHTGYRTLYPLHVHYKGSQLAYGLHYLHIHPNVSLVSLMIGANDGFLCLDTTKHHCSTAAELDAFKDKVAHNVRHILGAIRHKAHYQGQLAIINYYAPSPADAGFALLLNKVVDKAARPFHVRVADGYGAFAVADKHSAGNACTAGLVTQLGQPGKCGIHPSYAGQALLAESLLKVIRIG